MLPLALLVAALVPLLFEARVAARHDRALRAAGAVEPSGDVFRLMQVAYPACFVGMVAEAWARGSAVNPIFAGGVAVFALAKGLKYWAIATLGPRWSFRVLVPPRASRIGAGPYRFLRHPNYAAVVGELAGMALMAQAPMAGTVSIVGFGLLLIARIRVEERALGMRP